MAKKSYSFIAPTRPPQSQDIPNLSVVFLGSKMLNRTKTLGSHYLLGVSNHKSLLDYQIEQCKIAFPRCELLFIAGFESDRIIKKRPKDLRIIENNNWENNNQIEEVRLALNNIINNHVVFISHDSLFNHQSFSGMLTGSSTLEFDAINSECIGIRSNGGYVECFSYHVEKKWPGIVYLTDKELELMKQFSSVRDNGVKFLFEGLTYILTKRNIRCVKNNGLIGKITSVEDITRL